MYMKVVEVVRREIKETERKSRKKRSLGNEQARSARILESRESEKRIIDGW